MDKDLVGEDWARLRWIIIRIRIRVRIRKGLVSSY